MLVFVYVDDLDSIDSFIKKKNVLKQMIGFKVNANEKNHADFY